MKPKRIILIRHGESEGNVDKMVYGIKPDYALELTNLGKEQAIAAGNKLKAVIDDESAFFYVSPLWRTRMTFEGIVQALNTEQYRYTEEPRLREQEWGHLKSPEECDRIDEERDNYGPFYYRIPGGESCADVYDRVSDFFGTLHRDFNKPDFPENCVIVTHGMTIRLFLMKWFHWTVEEFEKLGNPPNCELIVLQKMESEKYILMSELKRRPAMHNYQKALVSKNPII